MYNIIPVDERRTINDVRNILDLSHGTFRRIWNEDINTIRTAATFVPLCWRTTKKNQTFFPQIPARSGQTGEKLCFKGLLVPKDENPVKRTKMGGYRGDSSRKAGSAGKRHETALQKMLATVREALGPQWKGQYRHVPVLKPTARTSCTTFRELALFPPSVKRNIYYVYFTWCSVNNAHADTIKNFKNINPEH